MRSHHIHQMLSEQLIYVIFRNTSKNQVIDDEDVTTHENFIMDHFEGHHDNFKKATFKSKSLTAPM